MKRLRPVAITGMGCLCAAGLDVPQCVDSLFRGRRHPAPPTRLAIASPPAHPVFEITEPFYHPSRFRQTCRLRNSQMALTAVAEALADAGWDRARLGSERVGVCIGSSVDESIGSRVLRQSVPPADVPVITPDHRFLMSNPAVHIAREFDLSGPRQTVVNACAASADAIGLAAAWIRSGICDAVIAGGVDELYPVTYNGFISLMNSDRAPCRPFDAGRNGLNLGEGAAMMILEAEESVRRGVRRPRAYLLGYGTASDAYHFTSPHPQGKGLRLALTEALQAGGFAPADMAFINAHGTGTLDNDRIEAHLFHEMFADAPYFSTKGLVGHTLGAAGAIDAVFTVACLERGEIPPSAGFSTPDPDMPTSPVAEVTAITGSIALSDTLAFGGTNSALVLGTTIR
ncbi:MAG: beta-ketoacyl-[acyl-carrier-protein] synthase family protein [Desulfobacterales bacterium]